jgi:hypothetical protein
MSKKLVAIGGPWGAGASTIARRIWEKDPSYNYFDMHACASRCFARGYDRREFESWFLESIGMLPSGITIINWGSYIIPQGREYEPFVSADCVEAMAEAKGVDQVLMFLVDLDVQNIQERRRKCGNIYPRPVSTDFITVRDERVVEVITFGEYVSALRPPYVRNWHFLYHLQNILFEVTTKEVEKWIGIYQRLTATRLLERQAA